VIEIKTILCPVDLSEGSKRALHQAIVLAGWYGAALDVLHVYLPPMVPVGPSEFPGLPPYETLVDPAALSAQVRAFAEPAFDAGIPTIARVAEGNPWKVILKEAEAADLLVVGTHGRSGFERLLLGSVTEKLLHRAACPVVTVPPGTSGAAAGAFKRVVCPVDFSAASIHGLEYAFSLAREADARVTILHVIESFGPTAGLDLAGFTVPQYLEALRTDARRRLAALVPVNARDWCEPEEVLTTGQPAQAILDAAASHDADLIVMGVGTRSAAGLLVLGSVASKVVRRATCPVMTVRD
jgi:nucleotide-binding universal stress UspA family protein